jgi:hypothetical protein
MVTPMNTGLKVVFCVFVSVSVGDTHKGLPKGEKGGVGTDTLTTLTRAVNKPHPGVLPTSHGHERKAREREDFPGYGLPRFARGNHRGADKSPHPFRRTACRTSGHAAAANNFQGGAL